MDDELKKFISNRKLVTYRVLEYISLVTKGDVCNLLKISRPTLDRRLKDNKWKLSEIVIVSKKMPF